MRMPTDCNITNINQQIILMHVPRIFIFIVTNERTINIAKVYVTTGGPGSSVGIETELPGWTVLDQIPVGTRFSARPDRLWGPPSLL